MDIKRLEDGKTLFSKINRAKSNLLSLEKFGDKKFSLYNGGYCDVPIELRDTFFALIEMQLNKNLKEYEKLFEEL